MRLIATVIGGYVVAGALLYAISRNSTASAWFGWALLAAAAVLMLLTAWTLLRFSGAALWAGMKQPVFPKPEAVFVTAIGILLFWTLLAPGGFLTCRPTATGNMIVDWLCEPLYDSAYPRESREAIEAFWSSRPAR